MMHPVWNKKKYVICMRQIWSFFGILSKLKGLVHFYQSSGFSKLVFLTDLVLFV